jgi:hypothetical protein
MALITHEVDKFLKTKRLNAKNITELDKKIAVEIYLREKKEAIIEDRKDESREIETESNLGKVR